MTDRSTRDDLASELRGLLLEAAKGSGRDTVALADRIAAAVSRDLSAKLIDLARELKPDTPITRIDLGPDKIELLAKRIVQMQSAGEPEIEGPQRAAAIMGAGKNSSGSAVARVADSASFRSVSFAALGTSIVLTVASMTLFLASFGKDDGVRSSVPNVAEASAEEAPTIETPPSAKSNPQPVEPLDPDEAWSSAPQE